MATEGAVLPPLSMYLHLPWCVRKCPYCDFNSHTAGKDAPKERYVSALERDIEMEAASNRARGRQLQSVFLGGGTPSLFSADLVSQILRAVDRCFEVADDAEITMEANPGAVEYDDFAAYRAAGVTRISLGAQSFDADALRTLGRIHGPPEIERAFHAARAAGFDSINLDLMFALPNQDTAMAMRDLELAIELAPGHISWYQLTLEPNTVFHSQPPQGLPDDDLAWEIQSAGSRRLRQAGFAQYEISAWSKPGQHCRHNLNYWTFGDYFALGAGAHGKVTLADGTVARYVKPMHPISYIDAAEGGRLQPELRELSQDDLGFEFLLNALRLPGGFTESEFRARTGQPFQQVAAGVDRACQRQLMESAGGGRWRPSELGLRFLNDLQASFLPPE